VHVPLIVGIEVDLAPLDDLAHEIDQSRRGPSGFQADAHAVAGVGVELERYRRLAAQLRPLEPPGDDETDSLKVVGDVRDGLGTQGDQIDDLFPKDASPTPDHVEHDAAVVGRARLLRGAAADHRAAGLYTRPAHGLGARGRCARWLVCPGLPASHHPALKNSTYQRTAPRSIASRSAKHAITRTMSRPGIAVRRIDIIRTTALEQSLV
jgi:hypothetical protein